MARDLVAAALLFVLPCDGLVGTTWQLSLSLGRIGTASRALPEEWREQEAPDGRGTFSSIL